MAAIASKASRAVGVSGGRWRGGSLWLAATRMVSWSAVRTEPAGMVGSSAAEGAQQEHLASERSRDGEEVFQGSPIDKVPLFHRAARLQRFEEFLDEPTLPIEVDDPQDLLWGSRAPVHIGLPPVAAEARWTPRRSRRIRPR